MREGNERVLRRRSSSPGKGCPSWPGLLTLLGSAQLFRNAIRIRKPPVDVTAHSLVVLSDSQVIPNSNACLLFENGQSAETTGVRQAMGWLAIPACARVSAAWRSSAGRLGL
jgi:hypothetical protein